jgi:hypothetical protein
MISMVIPFSIAHFATPIMEWPYEPNLKKNWERMLKQYPDLKYLLSDS